MMRHSYPKADGLVVAFVVGGWHRCWDGRSLPLQLTQGCSCWPHCYSCWSWSSVSWGGQLRLQHIPGLGLRLKVSWLHTVLLAWACLTWPQLPAGELASEESLQHQSFSLLCICQHTCWHTATSTNMSHPSPSSSKAQCCLGCTRPFEHTAALLLGCATLGVPAADVHAPHVLQAVHTASMVHTHTWSSHRTCTR